MTDRERPKGGVTRRGLLKGTAALGAASASSFAAGVEQAAAEEASYGMVPIELTINGTPTAMTVDSRTTLLDLLREGLDLTGTKVGCNHGQCGACTVLVDGTRVNSCLQLAAMANGKAVTTIEGLGKADDLHPMQQAFIEHDGFQCGYCTPGQVVSAVGCVTEGHVGSDAEIREYMSGNLCRCGAYKGIVAAIASAADATRERSQV